VRRTPEGYGWATKDVPLTRTPLSLRSIIIGRTFRRSVREAATGAEGRVRVRLADQRRAPSICGSADALTDKRRVVLRATEPAVESTGGGRGRRQQRCLQRPLWRSWGTGRAGPERRNARTAGERARTGDEERKTKRRRTPLQGADSESAHGRTLRDGGNRDREHRHGEGPCDPSTDGEPHIVPRGCVV